MEHEIVLKPEVLGYLGVLPVTNTLLVAWITMAILIILALFIKFRMKTIPGKFQNLIEIVIDTGYKTVE